MPQVKGGQKGRSSGAGRKPAAKKPSPAKAAVAKQTADASSIIMSIVFLIAILVGAAAWMGQSISVIETKANQLADGTAKTFGFSIKSIHVIEVSDDLERVIRREIGVAEGDNMFRADPQTLKARLESVKGFGDIQVHRFWPNQVTVFVTPLETSVLYRDDAASQLTAMHYTGEEAAELEPEAEYHIVQGEGAVEAWPELAASLQDLPALETRLDYAERIGNRRWDLIMSSGARVRLPADDSEESALLVLAALQRETGVLDRQVQLIDLRDPARVYVKREDAAYADAQTGGAG